MEVIELDRVIVVSEDVDRTVAEFTELLDLGFSEPRETQPGDEPLRVTYGFPGLELVSPDDDGDGDMSRFLESVGEGLYGVVFRVDNIVSAREYLADREVEPVMQTISDPATSLFYHPKHFSGVFVVLTEYPHPLDR